MFTEQELYEHLLNGASGHLQLSYEDASTIQKILISNGYVVLMSHGDIGDTYKIEWVYGGDVDNLKFADSNNVVFGHRDYLDMLYWKDYEEESKENTHEE